MLGMWPRLLQVCIRITCARNGMYKGYLAAPTPGMYKGLLTCALNAAAPTPGMYKGYLCSECGRAYSRYV